MDIFPGTDATEREREALNPVPWGWYLGMVAVLAGTSAVLFVGWGSIPDPFPSRWDAGGRPVTFRDKQVTSVLSVVFVVPFSLLVVGVLAALADHSRQAVHGTGPEAGRARMLSNLVQPVLARFLFLTTVVVTSGSLWSVFGMTQGAWSFWGMLGVIVVLILAVFRKAAVITRRVEERYPSDGDRRVFKWGLFYFNPDDDEMIINSGGLNIPNFGNKYLWVLLGVLVGFSSFIAVLASVAG